MSEIASFIGYLWELLSHAAEMGDWFVVRAEGLLAVLFVGLLVLGKAHPKKWHAKWKVREEFAQKLVARIAVILMLLVVFVLAPYLEVRRSKQESEASSAEAKLNKDANAVSAKQLRQATHENEMANLKLSTLALASGSSPTGGLNEKLDYFISNFESTKTSVQNLAAIAEAEKEYHEIAALNMIGKPFPDGDLIYTTAISKALVGAYEISGPKITYKTGVEAEKIFRGVIQLEPRFPFSYAGLAISLHDRGDSSWLVYYNKALGILGKTTLVPGHHRDHDLLLQYLKAYAP
jgi:hypothetical protein